jgi:hypothetical protein
MPIDSGCRLRGLAMSLVHLNTKTRLHLSECKHYLQKVENAARINKQPRHNDRNVFEEFPIHSRTSLSECFDRPDIDSHSTAVASYPSGHCRCSIRTNTGYCFKVSRKEKQHRYVASSRCFQRENGRHGVWRNQQIEIQEPDRQSFEETDWSVPFSAFKPQH